MPATTNPTPTPEVTAMNTTSTTSPFPYLPANALRYAHEVLTGAMFGFKAEAVTLDAHSFGVTDVDTVTVTMRDLEFIHSLDASRFGSHDECPICEAD